MTARGVLPALYLVSVLVLAREGVGVPYSCPDHVGEARGVLSWRWLGAEVPCPDPGQGRQGETREYPGPGPGYGNPLPPNPPLVEQTDKLKILPSLPTRVVTNL